RKQPELPSNELGVFELSSVLRRFYRGRKYQELLRKRCGNDGKVVGDGSFAQDYPTKGRLDGSIQPCGATSNLELVQRVEKVLDLTFTFSKPVLSLIESVIERVELILEPLTLFDGILGHRLGLGQFAPELKNQFVALKDRFGGYTALRRSNSIR